MRTPAMIAVVASMVTASVLGSEAAARGAHISDVGDAPCHAAANLSSPEPVLAENFPDAFVWCSKGEFYAVATNSGGINVQVARSADLRTWSLERTSDGHQLDALPTLPDWVEPAQSGRDVWAPEVMKIGRAYILYFSARHRMARTPEGRKRECIGVAQSDAPDRGFLADPTPLICSEFEEGVIDPSPFREGVRLYLYFKTDGNCCNLRASIDVNELTPDGHHLKGEHKSLGIVNDRCSEGSVVEAPTMLRWGRAHYLFYSAGDFSREQYNVAFARCAGPSGPCVKPLENRVLTSSVPGVDPPLAGPGHQSIVVADGRSYITYHALVTDASGHASEPRYLHVNELDWSGKPKVRLPVAYSHQPLACK